MDLGGDIRRRHIGTALARHRVAIASYLALALAIGTVVTFAVSAQGFRAHQTRLNDGGIWVTDNADSGYGRINKPIGELDGVIFAGLSSNLDVSQDDSAVVGVNLSGGTITPLDPATMRAPEGASVPIPAAPAVQEQGSTLAVLDTAKGTVWSTRVDPVEGLPNLTPVSRTSKPLASAGKNAALAVSDGGTVWVLSAATGTLLSSVPATSPTGFGPIHTQKTGITAKSLGLTTVGETPVVLDPASGALSVIGGAKAKVPAGSVLQQPGPDSSAVLVAASTALLSVDLSSGAVTTVAGQVRGRAAQPVRLGSCSYGAWSGGTGYVATRCDGGDPIVAGLRKQTTDLVFRVNRGQILLNDRGDGAVWNIDKNQPERLDNWDAWQSAPTRTTQHNHDDHPSVGDRQPPKAKDDYFGARPGRATVLHPLDNDTAAKGRLLAIRSVRTPSDPAAKVRISPDGQTVTTTLPANARGSMTFEYFVDDGRDGVSGHATVHVAARLGGVNASPAPRAGSKQRIWNIPAQGSMTIPVLADWRDDKDGDAITLVSAEPESGLDNGASASITSAGSVRFQAPDTAGLVKVRYAATDSLSAPVERELTFRVESANSDTTFPAVAEPDVVVGEVDKPITIEPLLNDLPGSDPFEPHAALELAGRVAQPPGAEVKTDLEKGSITLDSSVAHTYFLDYQAAYGNARTAGGRIRVDVRSPDRSPQDPVAMPDQVTLYGQAPSLVDVLANDSDPAGGLLEVQTASASDPAQLDVGVVDGRWLRISAPRGTLAPNPQVVTYQITDGDRSGITGQVVVNQRPEPKDDSPVTNDDDVTVRAGNSIAIPVLDNDFSPSGDQLNLLRTVTGQRPGRLATDNEGSDGPTGSAYVVGRQVRFLAPDVEQGEDVQVTYIAVNSSGQTAPGTATVTIIPRQKDNNPPEPPTLEGRVVSGDQVRLRLPGSGVDPDGDSVTILGLDTAPALGRVLRIGANSIIYQAYPDSVGTDEFTYQLTDSLGAGAVGTARVVVAPPDTPQAPLAVADDITVAPGRTASVDVLANDLISSGDRVAVSLVQPPAGVSLVSATGPVRITAPRTADGRNEVVVYRISNGIDVSQATVTLSTVPGYNNPPVVFDSFGSTGNGSSVTTDVLATAYDPDGPASALHITKVLAPRGVKARVIGGSRIRVSRGAAPIVVPFVVADGDGGTTTGSLYVPAATGGRPYVKPNATIRLKADGSFTGILSDYVVNPSGGKVQFTGPNRVWASPQPGVDDRITGKDTFRLDASKHYAGPGAMVFEVTAASGNNASNNRHGKKAMLTIPVQVGVDKPILRCPSNSLTVPQGESITVDILALCHVWTLDPGQRSQLTYAASWAGPAKGLSLAPVTGAKVQVRAGNDITPGTTAVLDVSASGSDQGQIRIRVARTAPPRLVPIQVSDLKVGESRTIDLSRYLIAGVRNPQPYVVSATQTSGVPVRITSSGASVTLRALRHVHGHATFQITMSDAGKAAGPERRVQGQISLDILDVPGQPGRPLPDAVRHDSRVPMVYSQAVANGSAITGYQVRDDKGRSVPCGSTSCTFSGLTNGTTYRFAVRAQNAVGWGPWSAYSRPATPDARAGQVSAVRMTRQDDHTIGLAWDRPPVRGSQITSYKITWRGAGRVVTATGEHVTINNLDNDSSYRFLITPVNGFGAGNHYRSQPFQPMGTPSAPSKPVVQDIPQSGSSALVAVSWSAVDPNGPSDTRYDVYRDGTVVCPKIQATTCNDSGMPYDGRTYTYTVTATNKSGNGKTSTRSVGTTYQSVGTPSSWVNSWAAQPTGNDQEVQLSYTVPASRGSQSKVDVLVNGAVNQSYNETGAQTHKISVPSDDSAYNISLRVCNEFNRCTTTAGTQSVQAYGPLRDSSIASVGYTPSGPNVTYQISGNTNGRPATLVLTHGGGNGSQQTWNLGPGPFSVSSDPVALGFNATETVQVTLRDPQISRGSGFRQSQGQAQGPPQANVRITPGARCNDDPSKNLPACNSSGNPFDDCTDDSCAFVVISLDNNWVDNFGNPGSATCRVVGAQNGPVLNLQLDNSQVMQLDGGNGPRAYASNGSVVQAHCDGNQNSQQADTSYTWSL